MVILFLLYLLFLKIALGLGMCLYLYNRVDLPHFFMYQRLSLYTVLIVTLFNNIRNPIVWKAQLCLSFAIIICLVFIVF
jgi:hypothetical protein